MLSANPQNMALKFDCFMSTVDFDKKRKVKENRTFYEILLRFILVLYTFARESLIFVNIAIFQSSYIINPNKFKL